MEIVNFKVSRPKRPLAILAAAAMLVAANSFAYADSQSGTGQIADLPVEAQGLIPENSRVLSAWSADLANDGHTDWAVLYVTPGSADVAEAHALILEDRGGWHI